MHSIQPPPSGFIPRPLILVQRARASSLNSEVESLTRAVEQKVSLVKRSLPSLPPSPRSEPQVTYLRNGRPLPGQTLMESYAIPLPTPPMTPENRRTFNPPHSRASTRRRTHFQVAPVPPASPLSTDITNSLLFSNDTPLLSSDPSSLVDHPPGRPGPPSELPAVPGLDLLSEFNSCVGENGSRASCKSAHASSVPFLAAEHKQQKEITAHDDIPNSESFRPLQHKVTPPPQHPQIHDSISVLKVTVPITAQQTTDSSATKDNMGTSRPTPLPVLKIGAQQPSSLASTSFTSTYSPSTYTYSPSLRSVRLEHRPPTPPLRKPLPLRPVTRKPPPAIPAELLAQTPTEVSTVAFPSSTSSPIPRVWSAPDPWNLSPSSSPSPSIPHRTPSSRVMSKLEPVIECPFLEGRGRVPSCSNTTESHSRHRRSTSFEGALRRRRVEFLGLNKSTPELRLGSSSANEKPGKGRDSPRARILSLGLLRRPRTGSRPKLFISSPLSNPPSGTPSGLFTSSLPQESSSSTPSPTTSKRSSSFRRWTNFVAKLFEPSSSSRPSSPSTSTSPSHPLAPTNPNTNASPPSWISVPPAPPSLGKANKRRLPHSRSFSQGMDNSLKREADGATVSGLCLPAGIDPGRRPSLP